MLTAAAVDVFHGWLEANSDSPLPSANTKARLAAKTGVTLKQVATWFENKRKRSRRQANQSLTAVCVLPTPPLPPRPPPPPPPREDKRTSPWNAEREGLLWTAAGSAGLSAGHTFAMSSRTATWDRQSTHSAAGYHMPRRGEWGLMWTAASGQAASATRWVVQAMPVPSLWVDGAGDGDAEPGVLDASWTAAFGASPATLGTAAAEAAAAEAAAEAEASFKNLRTAAAEAAAETVVRNFRAAAADDAAEADGDGEDNVVVDDDDVCNYNYSGLQQQQQ